MKKKILIISQLRSNLTKEKNRLAEHAFKINEQRSEMVKNLGDKYGDKQVNLETGELG
jgi:hypothetical protein